MDLAGGGKPEPECTFRVGPTGWARSQAETPWFFMPGVPAGVGAVLQAAREQTHTRLVAASRNGRRVEVADSSHDVQLDAPEAVVAAVAGVLAPAR